MATDEVDPFAPENISIANFIIQARLYDVAMALLTKLDPEVASELLELHATGALMGPSPAFVGDFVTDALNSESDDTDEN